MRRLAIAVLVVMTIGLSAPSASAARRYGHWRHHRVAVRHYVVVVDRTTDGRSFPGRVHRRVKRDLSHRFIPLPVPRGLWVPPPFSPRHPF
jgi:hypothetical protein